MIDEYEWQKIRDKCYNLKKLYEALLEDGMTSIKIISKLLWVDVIPDGVSLNLGERILVRLEKDGQYTIVDDLKQKISEYASKMSGDILADIKEFIDEKDC
jgi:hypothetical protein